MNDFRMLIGGNLIPSASGKWDISYNPATEEALGRAPAGTADDADLAVEAAYAARGHWNGIGPAGRADAMRAFSRALEERGEELAKLEAKDTGNTIRQVRGDIRLSVGTLNYFAGLTYELKGTSIPGGTGTMHVTMHEPYGIVVRIVPFNHPLMFAVARTAAALAAGNAVIVKAPETSPLSVLLLGEIAQQTLPPGVFNIVTGSGAVVGERLVRHPKVKRVAFIGAAKTGQMIQQAAASAGIKHVTLELGGKNPMIIFPDCEPSKVAAAAVRGMNFNWQGQSCGSTSRVLVHEALHDEVVEKILEGTRSVRLGNPLSEESTMGPINSAAHLGRVLEAIDRGKVEGAQLRLGGTRPSGADFRRGYWLEPTVFADVQPGTHLAREEVFGPVLSIMKWRDADDLLMLANDTEYGLAAAIWTNQLDAALQTARDIEAGFVWINTVSAHYRGVPFGGQKSSGIGREESIEEMFSYTETKTLNIAFEQVGM